MDAFLIPGIHLPKNLVEQKIYWSAGWKFAVAYVVYFLAILA